MFLFTHTPTAIWRRSSCLGQRVWNRPSWTTSTAASTHHCWASQREKGAWRI